MKWERILLWLIIVVLGGLLAIMVWNDYRRLDLQLPIENKEKALTVSTRVLSPQTVTITQTYLGTVQSIHSVPIKPYLSGFIDKISVTGGQSVTAGELMFTLQQGSYRAARDQALAKVAQAEATLANASAYLNRIKNTASKAISKTELDNATASFLSAEADVKAARAAVKTADVNYGYTEMRAPIDGVIGDVYITVGDYVSPSSNPLTTIVQYNPIRVVFSIPYDDYTTMGESLFRGWSVGLELANGTLYPESGQIRFTDNQVNPRTSSVRLYADFPNPDNTLLPNAFVTVRMTKRVRGVLVKKEWVILTPTGDFIPVLKNGRIEKQPVVLGPALGDSFVITQDVLNTYTVITSRVNASLFGKRAVSSHSDGRRN